MFLFGPPDIEKLKAKRDINGLKKALEYKNDERIRTDAARALDELGYRRDGTAPQPATVEGSVNAPPAAPAGAPSADPSALTGGASFSMKVENVFFIRNRGVVATGRVGQGKVKKGDQVEIRGRGTNRRLNLTQIEMFRKIMDEASAGENVGLLFKDANSDDIKEGDVIVGVA